MLHRIAWRWSSPFFETDRASVAGGRPASKLKVDLASVSRALPTAAAFEEAAYAIGRLPRGLFALAELASFDDWAVLIAAKLEGGG